MMQTTQARAGNHRCLRIRFLLDRATIRSVFVERVVSTVLLKVSDVFSHQPPQVRFVERDHVIQQFAATTSNPAFRDAVLPRRCDAGPLGFKTRCLEEGDNIGIELRVPIEDDVTVRAGLGECFSQLLDDPFCVWVRGDIRMQDLTSSMLNDEQAIEQLKGHGRHSEEVERYDHLPVIRQEGPPTLSRVTATANTPQVASDGPFANDEAELLEFAVDLGCAPTGILLRQTADQGTGFSSCLRSAATRSGSPSPK